MSTEFLSMFIDETKEHLEAWSNGLLELEKEYSEDQVATIFRSAHTIKGMAMSMGFERMGEVTHSAENLLDALRNKRLSVSSDLIDVLLQSVDTLSNILQHIEENEQEPNLDISELALRLVQYLNPNAGSPATSDDSKKLATVVPDYPVAVRSEIESAIEKGYRVYDADITFTEQCPMPMARWLQIRNKLSDENLIYVSQDDSVIESDDFDRNLRFILVSHEEPQSLESMMDLIVGIEVHLNKLSEVHLNTGSNENHNPVLPQKGHITDSEIITKIIDEVVNKNNRVYEVGIRLAAQTLMKSARVLTVFNAIGGEDQLIFTDPPMLDIENEKFETDIRFLMWSKESFDTINNTLDNITEIEIIEIREWKMVNDSVERGDNAVKPKQATDKKQSKKTSRTVRVDIEKLDVLMTLFSELVIDKTRFEKINEEMSHEGLSSTVAHMSRVSNELQEIIMQMRVIPLETIFSRFPRMVRDTAKKLGKPIEFIVTGEETELDRTVIEEIGDPIMHLLRNSLDHGIEATDKRIANGKPEVGRIELKAFGSGNSVYIEVADDGGGINTKKVFEKAVSKGLVSPDANLSEKEIHQLLFASGFSTADSITDLSGRGVGLDVVKGTVESLSGRIEVISTQGEGTRFVIQLPLTLAIMQALEIDVAGNPYFIPINSVKEIDRGFEIKVLDGRDFILWRGSPIPVLHLRREFQQGEDVSNPTYVIVSNGTGHLAVTVDDVVGEKEIVLKPLDRHFRSIPYFSGATILGDGSVSLILDLSALF